MLNELPRLARWTLRLFCHTELLEEVEGDILDNYNFRLRQSTRTAASLNLWIDVFFSMRFLTSKVFMIPNIMIFTNFLKIYLRQFSRNAGSQVLHMLGLAIGLLSFLAIYSYYEFEHSFDSYHVASDQLYRIERTITDGEMSKHRNGTSYLLPDHIKSTIPEVAEVTSIINTTTDRQNFQYPKGTPWNGFKFLPVSANFFDVFNLQVYEGNIQSALKEPKSIVITDNMRNMLFPSDIALNKTVYINGRPYVITAVIENVPDNTHFTFDYIIKQEDTFNPEFWDTEKLSTQWNYADFLFSYIRLSEDASIPDVTNKLNAIFESNKSEHQESQTYQLRPVKDIHLHANSDWELADNGNSYFLKLLLTLGVIILVFTTVNFAIISIAKITHKSYELALRKVIGSSNVGIASQVIFDNILTLFLSYWIALGGLNVLEKILPTFFPIALHASELLTTNAVFIQLAILISISFVSALYPMIIQFNIQPLEALKKKVLWSKQKFGILQYMVLLQIFFSVGLIGATFYFKDQVDYLLNRDPGFEVNNIVYMERYVRGENAPSYASFKNELLAIPGIRAVTNTAQLPLKWPAGNNYELVEEGKEKGIMTSRAWVGYDYFKTLGVRMLLGREFSTEFESDEEGIIISESAMKEMKLSDPIGKKVKTFFRGGEVIRVKTIVGVVEDFNYRSLHDELLPHYYILSSNAPLITLNLANTEDQNTIEQIKSVWKEYSPDEAFNITYLNKNLKEQYRADIGLKNAIEVLSIIMMVLASLGIFGVSAYIAQKRLQEISIRKILGAKSQNLFLLQMHFYLKILMLGFVISLFPIYYFVQYWMGQYAYQVEFNFTHFITTLLVVGLIVFAVSAFNTLKVALSNPINTLKNE